MDDGALELDMVINIGQLRTGKYDFVQQDIKAVCDAAHAQGCKGQSNPGKCLPDG